MEEEIEDILGEKPKNLITEVVNVSRHNYYLTEEIKKVEDYLELFKVLKLGTERDVVKIYLDSVGGSVSVGSMIINHILAARHSGVTVIANIGFTCASMASAIAMVCDDLEVNDYSQMLIHSWEGDSSGTAVAVLKDALFSHKQSEKFLRSYYTHFLTEKELTSLISSPEDLQFDAEEIKKRWLNVLKARSGENKELQSPATKSKVITPKKK